jgi:hypothetical protein
MRYLRNYKPQRLMISNDDLGTFVVWCLNLRISKQSVPSFASHNSVYRNIRLSLKSFHCMFGCRTENAINYDRVWGQSPRVQQLLQFLHILPFRAAF